MLCPTCIIKPDWERYTTIRFDSEELIAISKEKEFSYPRAQRWILQHEEFTLQIIAIYLLAIFVLKKFMCTRKPFKLDWTIRAWNLAIAILSGICAAGMTREFFTTLFTKGINASLCTSSDTFFHGSTGFYLWCYHIIRLFEFTDTLFIILRKQPLLFIHWYHHALTLYVSWFSYARPSPYSRFGIYLNSVIHTAMYIYFFLRASNIRLPLIVSKAITTAQIFQFIVAFWSIVHPSVLIFGFGMPCEMNMHTLAWSLFMDVCYLYLFIDFFRKKYNARSEKKLREIDMRMKHE